MLNLPKRCVVSHAVMVEKSANVGQFQDKDYNNSTVFHCLVKLNMVKLTVRNIGVNVCCLSSLSTVFFLIYVICVQFVL